MDTQAVVHAGQTISAAGTFARDLANGVNHAEFAASLVAASLEKPDVLLGMAFLGCALGAGTWIGWELTKFCWFIVASLSGLTSERRAATSRRESPN